MLFSDPVPLLSPQRRPGQRAVVGAVVTSGGSPRSLGAGSHSAVAQRPRQSLDRQRWISTVSQQHIF